MKGDKMKIRRVSRLASLVLLLSPLAWGEEAPSVANLDIKPQAHYGKIASKVANMLPTYHVTQQPLGEEVSQRAWTNLVTMYDYGHVVFLQEDLDAFAPMQRRIGDALRKGDVLFVYDMHRVFVHRLEECVTFVTNLLNTAEFDFSVQEECQFDRKDAPWPTTREERNELWRKRIKNEMLAQILSRELDDEEKAAGKKPRKKAAKKKRHAPAETRSPDRDKPQCITHVEVDLDPTNAVETVEKPEPTPKENLINKYRHYLAWVLTELDDEKVLERYLLAASMAYDPHSAYMAPMSKDDFDMDMNLSLCGVGAVLSQSMDDGALEIKEVMKGGPLAREGSIKEGDKIVGVGQGDGPIEDVVWKSMRKSIKKIRGKKDTKVVLEVTDKNGASRRRVPIIRDEIKLEDQAATGRVERVVLNGVTNVMGYVKLPAFYGTMDKRPNDPGYRSCSFDVAKWVALFNTEGANGMILDLRGNGGGSLREAVLLTALFVRPNPDQCPVVHIRENNQIYVLPTFPDQPTFAWRKPLIVMIDRHSASASEIVAGALQDTGRAVIVGDTQSHGKGTVQTVLPMGRADNGSMKITTARFYRINGSSTQVKGISSDIRLPSAIDERTDIGEDKLPNALPWSRIEPVKCDAIWNMGSFVDRLRSLSDARIKESSEWSRRFQLVKLCREASERKTVPLERAARKKMMKEDRDVFDEADDSLPDDEELAIEVSDGTEKPKDGADENAGEKPDGEATDQRKNDLVLTEALNILSDLVRLTGGAEAPVPQPPPSSRLPAWFRALGGDQ